MQHIQVIASLSKVGLLSKNHYENKPNFFNTTSLDIERNSLSETTNAGLWFFSVLMTGNKIECLGNEHK